DRPVVMDAATACIVVVLAGVFSPPIVDEEGITIIGKSFVYPNIGKDFCRMFNPEPFVTAFVDDYKIVHHAVFRSPAAIAEGIVVPISHGALMFHTGVLYIHQ